MDQFNVIEPTSDLDELDNDMQKWCSLPFKFRMRSNEECIRRYNMTNIDLYNTLKSKIISKTLPSEDPIEISSMVSEGAIEYDSNDLAQSAYFSTDEDKQLFLWKMESVKQLELSPNVVIICPFEGNEPDYTIEELENKFNKYQMLTPKNKRFSNSYSINLWNYDVPNMYQIMKQKIESSKNYESDTIVHLGESVIEKTINPLKNIVNEAFINNDILALSNIRLDSFSTNNFFEREAYKYLLKETNYKDTHYYIDSMNPIVPYFNLTNLKEMGIDNIKSITSLSEIKKIQDSYFETSNEEYKDELLSYGMNPEIPISKSLIDFCKIRQNKWLQSNLPVIVDINHYKPNTMDIIDKNICKEKGLYPVYINIFYSNNNPETVPFAWVKPLVEFKDIMIGIDNNFELYHYSNKNDVLVTLVMFVNKETRELLRTKCSIDHSNFDYILQNYQRGLNGVNVSAIAYKYLEAMVKSSKDTIDIDRPKLFKVHEGFVKSYDANNVDAIIAHLLKDKEVQTSTIDQVLDQISNKNIDAYFSKTENPMFDRVLDDIQSLLSTEPFIKLRSDSPRVF